MLIEPPLWAVWEPSSNDPMAYWWRGAPDCCNLGKMTMFQVVVVCSVGVLGREGRPWRVVERNTYKKFIIVITVSLNDYPYNPGTLKLDSNISPFGSLVRTQKPPSDFNRTQYLFALTATVPILYLITRKIGYYASRQKCHSSTTLETLTITPCWGRANLHTISLLLFCQK